MNFFRTFQNIFLTQHKWRGDACFFAIFSGGAALAGTLLTHVLVFNFSDLDVRNQFVLPLCVLVVWWMSAIYFSALSAFDPAVYKDELPWGLGLFSNAATFRLQCFGWLTKKGRHSLANCAKTLERAAV